MSAVTPGYRRLLRSKGEHGVRPYVGYAARGWLSLLRIDLWRGGGALLVPIGLIFAWIILRGALTPGVAIWPEITAAIADMAGPLTLATIGIGGYAGGRERRGEVMDMTGITPIPAWQRYLSLTTSLFIRAIVVYALFAIPLLAYGMAQATWGGPDFGVIGLGVPYIALAAAFGVGVGRVVGGKTAPIIAIAAFLLVFSVLPSIAEETRLLGAPNPNAWFRSVVENAPERPVSPWAQVAWSVGLTGMVLGADIWRECRTRLAGSIAAAAAVLALGGALVVVSQHTAPTTNANAANVMAIPEGGICEDVTGIDVCVHPAYERMLPDIARDVEEFLGPVAGLEGVVDRVYLSSGNMRGGGWDQDDDHAVTSIDLWVSNWSLREQISQDLWPYSFMLAQEQANPVQYVVMSALARNIGIDSWPEHFYRVPADAENLDGEVERFAELSPEDQRIWLEANWDDLIHGRLTVEDLP